MMNESTAAAQSSTTAVPGWKKIVAKYQKSSVWPGVRQLLNTVVPYAVLWYLIYLSLPNLWWLTIPLALLAGGFLVRIFVIFHDCCHLSFFPSRRANEIVGFIAGVLTFTPYHQWRWEHNVHHSTSGDLDRRGIGDIWTLTVQEYLEASRWKRFAYRLARNPVILFGAAPLYVFLIKQRIPSGKTGQRERLSVWCTNLGIVAVAAGMSWLFGLKAYLLLQSLMVLVAGSAGIWLFYVQHQFEGAYWQRSDDWEYSTAALKGSSFYKLPKILQWFSGNIGFHHIHHLSPRIPNYHLEKCHRAEPLFQTVKPVTLLSSLKSFTFRLWDEQQQRLVGYRALRTTRERKRQTARC